MSYKRIENSEDSISNMLSNAAQFQNMSGNLLNASSFEAFQVWFEKLELVDRRMLYFFIKANKEKFTDDQIEYATIRFKKFNKGF